MDSDFLTAKEAASLLRVHRNTLRNWIRHGCPSYTSGHHVWVKLAEVEGWLKRQAQAKQRAWIREHTH